MWSLVTYFNYCTCTDVRMYVRMQTLTPFTPLTPLTPLTYSLRLKAAVLLSYLHTENYKCMTGPAKINEQ